MKPITALNERGQTIIEVLLATGVISVALTVLVSVTTASIARNREAKARIVATRLAQEGLEWFRSERDRLQWVTFEDEVEEDADASHVTRYCLNKTPIEIDVQTVTTGGGSANYLGSCAGSNGLTVSNVAYRRELVANTTIANTMPVTVVIAWMSGNREDSATISGLLQKRY